jgi:Fur family ferric uptake transcriptional regulator
MQKKILSILKEHQLKNTQFRRDVLKVFLSDKMALAHADLEEKLQDVDRITLYRTLKTFETKGIIHKAIDSGDKMKYAICAHGCTEHQHVDEHAHFHCENCDRTYCLDDVFLPSLKLPKGYTLKKAHLVLDGFCQECGE